MNKVYKFKTIFNKKVYSLGASAKNAFKVYSCFLDTVLCATPTPTVTSPTPTASTRESSCTSSRSSSSASFSIFLNSSRQELCSRKVCAVFRTCLSHADAKHFKIKFLFWRWGFQVIRTVLHKQLTKLFWHSFINIIHAEEPDKLIPTKLNYLRGYRASR